MTSNLSSKLRSHELRVNAAAFAQAQNSAAFLENAMKENRPWEDRTGDARKRLSARVYKTEQEFVIELSQGVDYGIYLEKAHEEKYAIIKPTIRKYGREVMDTFASKLRQVKW